MSGGGQGWGCCSTGSQGETGGAGNCQITYKVEGGNLVCWKATGHDGERYSALEVWSSSDKSQRTFSPSNAEVSPLLDATLLLSLTLEPRICRNKIGLSVFFTLAQGEQSSSENWEHYLHSSGQCLGGVGHILKKSRGRAPMLWPIPEFTLPLAVASSHPSPRQGQEQGRWMPGSAKFCLSSDSFWCQLLSWDLVPCSSARSRKDGATPRLLKELVNNT